MNRREVFDLLDKERDYQQATGRRDQHTMAEWLRIMKDCLNRAMAKELSVTPMKPGDTSLDDLRKAVAVGVAALEDRGGSFCVDCSENSQERTEMAEWIPVTESLPALHMLVLAFIPQRLEGEDEFFIAWREARADDGWTTYDDRWIRRGVTHWRGLPDAPTGWKIPTRGKKP